MCRRSRNGSRIIVIGLCLSLLLASPCFAAASWGGLAGGRAERAISEQAKAYSEEYLEEFSTTESTTPSGTPESGSLESLAIQLGNLKAAQEELQRQAEGLETSSQTFSALLESYSETGKISEAEYEAVKTTLVSVLAQNGEQADRIAKLEEEAGTKAYLMLDGIVGFKDSIPQFGAGVTVGARIGSDLMVEAGADYMIGGVNGLNRWSLDNWQFRAGVGWMF